MRIYIRKQEEGEATITIAPGKMSGKPAVSVRGVTRENVKEKFLGLLDLLASWSKP